MRAKRWKGFPATPVAWAAFLPSPWNHWSADPSALSSTYHGGGYVSGSPPDRYLPLAGAVTLAAQARVHVVDYRLAPDHRFPAAYDDCLAAYRWTVRDGGENPETLAVLGDSAGGNLALAVAARRP